jgi:ribosomal protein L29
MELAKLSKSDIQTYDAVRLREVEKDLRRTLVMTKMDLHTDKKVYVGKVRNLKKNIARVLTAQTKLCTTLVAKA